MSYEILLVSQFTLNAYLKGNKPDFHLAKKPEEAKVMWNTLIELMKKLYSPEKIQSGIFAAMMKVRIANSGPTCIIWNTKDKK